MICCILYDRRQWILGMTSTELCCGLGGQIGLSASLLESLLESRERVVRSLKWLRSPGGTKSDGLGALKLQAFESTRRDCVWSLLVNVRNVELRIVKAVLEVRILEFPFRSKIEYYQVFLKIILLDEFDWFIYSILLLAMHRLFGRTIRTLTVILEWTEWCLLENQVYRQIPNDLSWLGTLCWRHLMPLSHSGPFHDHEFVAFECFEKHFGWTIRVIFNNKPLP